MNGERSATSASLLSSESLLSAHMFPNSNSKNLSDELFRKKSFSFIKCWEIYKIEILSLKISHLGTGVRGIQGEVDLLVEKFFQSLRKGVWWRS